MAQYSLSSPPDSLSPASDVNVHGSRDDFRLVEREPCSGNASPKPVPRRAGTVREKGRGWSEEEEARFLEALRP